jgi:hypothetical protein
MTLKGTIIDWEVALKLRHSDATLCAQRGMGAEARKTRQFIADQMCRHPSDWDVFIMGKVQLTGKKERESTCTSIIRQVEFSESGIYVLTQSGSNYKLATPLTDYHLDCLTNCDKRNFNGKNSGKASIE